MKTLSIASRLKLGFSAITVAFLVLAALTVWRIEQASDAVNQINIETKLLQLAGKWQADVRQNSARSLAVVYSDGPALLDFFKDAMAATTSDTSQTQKTFLELRFKRRGHQETGRCGGRGPQGLACHPR
jgi:methyl-accepting chemotaxis protein